jgi:hypothetical protein
MRLIPEIRVPFANIGSRVANTGASFAIWWHTCFFSWCSSAWSLRYF